MTVNDFITILIVSIGLIILIIIELIADKKFEQEMQDLIDADKKFEQELKDLTAENQKLNEEHRNLIERKNQLTKEIETEKQ